MKGLKFIAELGLVGTLFCVASCGGGGGPGLRDHLIITRADGLVERDMASGDERLRIPNPNKATAIEPAVSPDGSQIAFTSLLSAFVVPGQPTDLGSDIYVTSADGSNARIVAEHTVRGEQLHTPAWLADGNLLISAQRFEDRQVVVEIELVDVAHGLRTVLIRNAFAPAPSPDGTKIVYIRPEPDLTLSLWIANSDGSDQRRLVPDSGLISFNRPRYSPDGRYVVVGAAGQGELLRAGDPLPEFVALSFLGSSARATANLNGLPEDIWLIDVQSGEARRLADLDLDQPTAVWSGDGQRIYALGDQGLYLIDVDRGSRRLADGMFHGQLDWLSLGE